MTLEEKLADSLGDPQTRDLLKDSVESVLRNKGWKEDEITEGTDLLMKKLYSHPAVHSGVSNQGPKGGGSQRH
jgi:hypothetical protein